MLLRVKISSDMCCTRKYSKRTSFWLIAILWPEGLIRWLTESRMTKIGLTGYYRRTSFASPTDNLMSPCTAKLQAHKKRHYVKYEPSSLPKPLFASTRLLFCDISKTNRYTTGASLNSSDSAAWPPQRIKRTAAKTVVSVSKSPFFFLQTTEIVHAV
ncbi:hypothetical protein V1504DRAFT_449567 [Lipomyces starkeyi]